VRGVAIFRNGHFLEYLHYLVYGPNLPERIIMAFRDQVARCGDVTSGDVGTLRAFAREQARSLGCNHGDVAEEFFKLALECGMDVSYARSVRDAVKQGGQRR
jgi:hypothetical protein